MLRPCYKNKTHIFGVMYFIAGNLNSSLPSQNFERSNPFTFLLTKDNIDKTDGNIWNWI
jgi:hypothetical protein